MEKLNFVSNINKEILYISNHKRMHEIFEEQCLKNPNKIAVKFGEKKKLLTLS
ncbi:hypothetical protein [Silvanigrella aquatica]|uniref:hypothetical protein n=1 Tax=Silvanigrella aquatica TaxID=1915309 RepID=UPI000AEEBF98|nr:hypothetical protein [Silvanigrella aquatica]